MTAQRGGAVLDTNTPAATPPREQALTECPYCGHTSFYTVKIFMYWHQACAECSRTVADWLPGMQAWRVKGIAKFEG